MNYEMTFINKDFETSAKKKAKMEMDREFWQSINER